jgi:Ca2+-binding EF-hand superfamily protein
MFEQKQVQEFKEAFGLMDQDRDGSISLNDLKEVYSSLGKSPKESELKEMLEDAGGPVNFTKLLQLFGDRLHGMKLYKKKSENDYFSRLSFRY